MFSTGKGIMPVIPATREAEAGESLEPGRLQGAEMETVRPQEGISGSTAAIQITPLNPEA